MKATLLASKGLRPTERLIMVAIAAHTNRDGDAWPSVATIADYAGVSVRTVQRTLAKLVHLGRLAVRQAASLATRIYRLLSGQPDTPGGDNQRDGVPNDAVRGDTHTVSPEAGEDHMKLRGQRTEPGGHRLPPRSHLPQQAFTSSGALRRPVAPSVARAADQCPTTAAAWPPIAGPADPNCWPATSGKALQHRGVHRIDSAG
ncbi:helix-turn-helix domain-containing protein [Micromonospora sp. R77]|uniref:helix-turn-helix domain-containing protein n=1 Tax=Micromonospora sp. R77 TaxID=2925836 RepID=UPI001F612E6D|nr:helix-turn-helix domain-containing protein [Micromonospora sp. R77]MCI4066305.1 helix-turn-helix domain-containing protein [Micromonospora sp. R77]